MSDPERPDEPASDPPVLGGRSEASSEPQEPSATAPVVAFTASVLAAIGLAIVYSTGGQPQAEGVLLAVALGGIGFG